MRFPRSKQPISFRRKIFLGIVGVSLLAMTYSHLSHKQHVSNPKDTTLPNIQQLVDGFRHITTPQKNALQEAFGLEDERTPWQKIQDTPLYQDTTATYWRLFVGLAWGCALSVVLGILMGCFASIGALLLPTLALLAKVPGTAMLAVFFVLAGTGEPMFTSMIAFGVLPTLTQAIYLSVKDDVHGEEIDKAYTLGSSNIEVIWDVVRAQIMPRVLDSIRLQIGPAMVYLIAAELLVGQVGFGSQIRVQQRLLNMNIVYDYLFILGVTGLAMDKLMLTLRERLYPWFERSNG
jgi:ABC-type nitrate/sulfonate/bicarbonate transport system permease component